MLSHSYHALERCAHEPSFQHYYTRDVVFSKPEYFSMPMLDESPATDINWRQAQGIAALSSGESLNWRNSPAQTSPQKKSKKGAYNFKRMTEDGVLIPGAVEIKKRKFYPRKE